MARNKVAPEAAGMAGFQAALRPDPLDDSFACAPLERRAPIAEQVSDRIIAMIKSGNLPPGEKLPTETQMTVAFGISRPPLREALKALTIMGILESRQGGRYYVTDLSPARLIAPFSTILAVADYDMPVHFEARVLVDLQIARLCAERTTAAEKARILQLARDGQAFCDDPVAFRLIDAEFHGAIAQGARNPLMLAMSQSLYEMQIDLRRIATTIPGVLATSVEQHCDLAEAIAATDAEAAARAAHAHLIHVRETTERAMLIRQPPPGTGRVD